MSKVERLRERARAAEARDPKVAIEAWLEVLKVQEDNGDPNPDLSIYNRIGDLHLKTKDPAQAADYYERGVDKYAELGFHNNAIALCNKVLRNAPARPTTYLKLAKLYAAKGFLAEARQNFVEYAERMKRVGNLDHAFAALKQVTDLSPDSENLRQMLEEHLRTYGEVQRRPSRLSLPGEPAPAAEPKVAKRKTSSLVFLDLDEPRGKTPAEPAKTTAAQPPTAKPTPPKAPVAKPVPPKAAPVKPSPEAAPRSPEPDIEFVRGLPDEVDEPLDVERTAAADTTEPAAADAAPLSGFETTSFDFDQVRQSAGHVAPVTDDERPVAPIAPLGGLEPTRPDDAPGRDEAADEDVEEIEEVAPPRRAPPPQERVARRVPERPPPAAAPPPARARPPIDVPPLELEPEFDTAATAGSHELDEEPLLVESEEPLSQWVINSDDAESGGRGGRAQGFIDLGLDGVTTEDGRTYGFGNAAPSGPMPTLADLEARVADDPDDPDAHRSLGEALIESGDRDRGIEELDHAASGYEGRGSLQQAQDLVDEILRLDPNSVRHRQRAVEYAYRSGNKDQLIEAYLELADALLRTNLPEKARAVYERVAEHDPGNARADAALNMLTAAPAAPPPGRVAARDARMRVRDEVESGAEFIDLGALVLEEDDAARDSRMRVEDEAPTGDEERDFQEMLARFKQGIDENIDETDFQSHYDLGVAFKEMGLLDEAIGEFQKALRAPEGKLRTSEALGVCFLEKGAHGVAESILRRALELPAGGDQERLGILYWLGRTLEQLGKVADAREYYGRVFAVDIRFLDVGERVKALSRA